MLPLTQKVHQIIQNNKQVLVHAWYNHIYQMHNTELNKY
jgi:hypothetical protein